MRHLSMPFLAAAVFGELNSSGAAGALVETDFSNDVADGTALAWTPMLSWR
jgi:hypothetical protein